MIGKCKVDGLDIGAEMVIGGLALTYKMMPIVKGNTECQKNRTKCRFFAVLHIWPITSPVEAVRAAIVAEDRVKS